jgi:hypothetical protein
LATIFGLAAASGDGEGGGGGAGAAGGAGGVSFEQAMPIPIVRTNAETKLAPRITDLPRPNGAERSIGKRARGRNLRTSGALSERTSDARRTDAGEPGAAELRMAPALLTP